MTTTNPNEENLSWFDDYLNKLLPMERHEWSGLLLEDAVLLAKIYRKQCMDGNDSSVSSSDPPQDISTHKNAFKEPTSSSTTTRSRDRDPNHRGGDSFLFGDQEDREVPTYNPDDYGLDGGGDY